MSYSACLMYWVHPSYIRAAHLGPRPEAKIDRCRSVTRAAARLPKTSLSTREL